MKKTEQAESIRHSGLGSLSQTIRLYLNSRNQNITEANAAELVHHIINEQMALLRSMNELYLEDAEELFEAQSLLAEYLLIEEYKNEK